VAHIEIKKINGREYRYERLNYRIGAKVKHKNKYLGPVSPIRARRKSSGRKSSVFVRQLNEKEEQDLIQKQKDPKAFVRDRAKIFLLSADGKTPKQIAEQLKRDYARTLKIINNFNKHGFDVLTPGKITGRPRRITSEQEKDIVETALKTPNEVNLPYNNWTCRLLALWFEQKHKQKISDERVRELLIKNKVTFTVPKHRLMKADAALREAFKKS